MRRLVARLPVWVRTQPLDCLLAALCLQSGLVSALGIGPTRPLEQLMPWWATRLWAVCLLIGAVCWLVGLTGIRERDGRLIASRLPILRLGLWLLSTVMLVYGLAIAVIGGAAGLLGAETLLLASALIAVRRADLGGES